MAIKEKNILIVVTSCDTMRSGHKTGLWFNEFAIPYSIFHTQGYRMTIASPLGGDTPIDKQSLEDNTLKNKEIKTVLHNTQALNEIDGNSFDLIYIPGGNGTMYDLCQNPVLSQLLLKQHTANKLIATVCHGAVCLTTLKIDNTPYVANRKLTCFSNSEELTTGQDKEYDFLLETRLRELGAKVTVSEPWSEHVVVDGKLISGQNPQSCECLAKVIVDLLK